ncbi:Amidohydrolase family [Rhynchospora pubera]|uniref:Amidohydrolase family n=1 Tax=Rhynchospora pubera TaxID=906938 RepID=A0AAV8GGI2_9POAL|nr:Amidohydrolase family [Rhynchospora pubera]
MAFGRNLAFFLAAAGVALFAIAFLPSFDSFWSSWRKGRKVAEMVVLNATIYTSDASLPFAEAMAVRDGRILRVGDFSTIQDLIGDNTYKLNLNGNVVLPGFIDSHVHLIIGGLQLMRAELGGIRNKEDFVAKVTEAVKEKTPGQWVLGGGWNIDLWGGHYPEASWLDDIAPQNPVWLSRMDRHMGVANSLALKNSGITRDTPDPAGGSILKNSDGEPNGLLVDSAMELVLNTIPEESLEERREALFVASRHALTRGVTTVVDMGRFFTGASVENSWVDLSEVYQWADSLGKMMIRVCLFFPLPTWSRLAELIRDKGHRLSEWIHVGGVKYFADGSLGSNSALLHEAYEDNPINYGIQIVDFDWLSNATLHSDMSGLQVAIHAIGDKANDMVLDMYSSVVSTNGIRDRRFRIEHAQHLLPSTAPRFGQEQVIPSVQPDHLLDDAAAAENKLGIKRAHQGSYLFQSLLDGGARLAFGSDWPVTDINPLRAIKTAIHRKPPGFDHAWIPTERVFLDDALKAHTISAAYACFLDKELGSLSPGKFADFVVLPANSWTEFAENPSNFVSATFVNGKQAYP